MNSIVHADIFFFVATCGLVIFIIVAVVGAFYGVLIARDVRHIVNRIREESENIVDDITITRQKIRDNGLKLMNFLEVIKNFITFKSFRNEKKTNTGDADGYSAERTSTKNHTKRASKMKIN